MLPENILSGKVRDEFYFCEINTDGTAAMLRDLELGKALICNPAPEPRTLEIPDTAAATPSAKPRFSLGNEVPISAFATGIIPTNNPPIRRPRQYITRIAPKLVFFFDLLSFIYIIVACNHAFLITSLRLYHLIQISIY